MRIRAIAVLLAVVAALGIAAPALAASVYYGSADAPITAESNSDDGNAWFHGAVMVKDQTWLRNRYWFRDSAPGGNRVYVTTTWYFWRSDCLDGSTCFQYNSEDRSSEDRSGEWLVEMDYVRLDSHSETGRALTRVCEKQAWSPDACSRYVYATLKY